MTRPTRQRLVEAAIRRFYRDGFRNVGIDQVLADVGISKTAFYKHFECKEDLLLAAMDMQNQWLQGTFRTMVRQRAETAIGRLHAAFDVVEHILASDDFQGCFFVNVVMEFPLLHEPAHLLASQSKRAIEELMQELSLEAGAGDPRGLAQELCLLMEGAYVTRQVTGDKKAVDTARRIARLLIDSRCPAANGAPRAKSPRKKKQTAG